MLIVHSMTVQSLCSDRQRFEFGCHIGNVEPERSYSRHQLRKKFIEGGMVANAAKTIVKRGWSKLGLTSTP